jgi:hypothetical protein
VGFGVQVRENTHNMVGPFLGTVDEVTAPVVLRTAALEFIHIAVETDGA